MSDEVPKDVSKKHWDLILRIARRPGFCCCCLCTPVEDRRRARRIFRLTHAIMRSWDKERAETAETTPH